MLRNKLKNSIVLDQTEGVFTDFNRRDFNRTAIDIYQRVADAIAKNNKTTMVALLSVSMQEAVSQLFKDDPLTLPFTFYENVQKAKLRQGNLW